MKIGQYQEIPPKKGFIVPTIIRYLQITKRLYH